MTYWQNELNTIIKQLHFPKSPMNNILLWKYYINECKQGQYIHYSSQSHKDLNN